MVLTNPNAWELLTKRTDDPKLRWIERQLDSLHLAHQRGRPSFHGPTLFVRRKDWGRADAILTRRVAQCPECGSYNTAWSLDPEGEVWWHCHDCDPADGEPVYFYAAEEQVTTIDEVPDDHPTFLNPIDAQAIFDYYEQFEN